MFLTWATKEMKLPFTEMRGLWRSRLWEMIRNQSCALGGHLGPLSVQNKQTFSPTLTFLWRVGDKRVIQENYIDVRRNESQEKTEPGKRSGSDGWRWGYVEKSDFKHRKQFKCPKTVFPSFSWEPWGVMNRVMQEGQRSDRPGGQILQGLVGYSKDLDLRYSGLDRETLVGFQLEA